MPPLWDYMAYPSLGVLNITFVAWDDMDMDVKDALPSRLSHVDADVVAVWFELIVEQFLFLFDELHAGSDFFRCQLEETGDMAARDDQGVTRARGVGITRTESKLMQYGYPAWIFAKQARIIGVSFLFLYGFRRQRHTSFSTLYSNKYS